MHVAVVNRRDVAVRHNLAVVRDLGDGLERLPRELLVGERDAPLGESASREHSIEHLDALRLVFATAVDLGEASIRRQFGPADRAAEVGPVPVRLEETQREEPTSAHL